MKALALHLHHLHLLLDEAAVDVRANKRVKY